MKDKSILMAEAMSYIDDRFLEEAHPEAYGQTQVRVERNKIIRRIAAVACLCLVAIGVFRISSLEKSNASGDMAPEADLPVMDEGINPPPGNDGYAGNSGTIEYQEPMEEAPSTTDESETDEVTEEMTTR